MSGFDQCRAAMVVLMWWPVWHICEVGGGRAEAACRAEAASALRLKERTH